MIHVNVRERDAVAQATEPITSGSVGLAVSFRFSEDWEDLAKVAVFKGSSTSVDVALISTDSCTVPHEVLQSAGGHLKIGVYGTGSQGQRVTPTIWADAGQIREGAEPSEVDPTPATESLVQQILEAAEDAADLAQSVRDDADNGVFDGEDGAAATVSVGTTTTLSEGSDATVTNSGTSSAAVLNFGIPKGDKGEDGNKIWYTNTIYRASTAQGYLYNALLIDLSGNDADPAVGDYVYGPESGDGYSENLYIINEINPGFAKLTKIGRIKGDAGAGFPAGGQKDNVLRKLSDDDYDTGWAYPSDMLSSDTKAALLQLAQKVAYIDAQGATYYQALYDALYPPKVLLYITAIYTQSGTVYDDDSLDSLKDDLLVKAKYDDNTEPYVTNYTLSGTLTAGTSTVTVTYNGKTTTFTVTVTARPVLSSISAVYTQSGTVYDTDTLDSLKDDLVVTAVYSDSSTATVAAADYTLSGTLAEGTSTITVIYGGKTATFSVTVTAYWDFQWDYTMGKLEEQTGWTVDKSSSNASTEITSSAERFTTGTTQYYQCYIDSAGSLAALRTMPNGIGVIQVTFSGYFGAPTSTNFEIIAAESASNRVRVCVNNSKFKLRDNSSIASATVLADFENNTEYTIRIVCKGTTADIYANGIKIGADIDMSTMVAGTSNSVITNALAPGYYADLKSLHLKVGSY